MVLPAQENPLNSRLKHRKSQYSCFSPIKQQFVFSTLYDHLGLEWVGFSEMLFEWVGWAMNKREALGFRSRYTTSPPERTPEFICGFLPFSCERPKRCPCKGAAPGVLLIWSRKVAKDLGYQGVATFVPARSTPEMGWGVASTQMTAANGPTRSQPCFLASWKLFPRVNIHFFFF